MAYVQRYKNDVFISYAHADDTPEASGKGWVSQFVTQLEGALKQRLGGTNALGVYFDSRNLNANNQLEELLEAVRNSAIFVAVASRSYANRDWTKRELEAFAKTAGYLRRLFAVECLPLDEGQTYPEPLQQHNRLKFWRTNAPHSLTPMSISPSLEADTFSPRVHDLAEQIRRQIKILNDEKETSGTKKPLNTGMGAPAGQPKPGGGSKRVLLAQVTDDLEEEREQVRRYLEQFGVTVLPESTYPQGGNDFKVAFTHDLAQSDIFVQLLGPLAGKIPPDLPGGYTHFQLDVASSHGLELVQWRRPEIDVESVKNTDYRTVLTAETVIATGLESFKAEVLRCCRMANSSERKLPSSLVFIDADRNDLHTAKAIQSEFSRYRVLTVVPTLEGPAEDVRTDLEENLIDCDALILIYGDATPLWVRRQLRLFNKIKSKRSAPPRLLAIYTGPPPDKPDIGFSFPDIREIDCRNTGEFEALRALITELSL